MIHETIIIKNRLGLHARAAAKFVTISSSFASRISLGREEQMVDGKSIMSVMMLAASQGTELIVEAEGHDERQAFQAIYSLVDDYFGEEG
ncbi:MAG: HPr family phosphocarrier protein [Endozoicomonadaceae bacterium]|nr:HPr family phosphocarrier protein [Endozoicomonadaceae bacterium]